MSTDTEVEELQASLIKRAESLAQEYSERARHSCDNLIEQENERMQLREQREIMAAKIQADRNYRSMVQSSELKVQKKTGSITLAINP